MRVTAGACGRGTRELDVSQVHVLRVAVFADNAETVVSTLRADGRRGENRVELNLVA